MIFGNSGLGVNKRRINPLRNFRNQDFENEFFFSHSKNTETESSFSRLRRLITKQDPWPEKIQAHQVIVITDIDVVVTNFAVVVVVAVKMLSLQMS
jgi:hypothetical protein